MVASAISEARSEIEYWRALGVAVLPGTFGSKRKWPTGWPELPHRGSWDRSHDRASRGPVNLALRLGATASGDRILGHVDFDAIGGLEPDVALGQARLLFPGAPLLRTSAGRWRMYFWSTREIADCEAPELGAEVAANVGRLSIVHGAHPSGTAYEWIEPPAGELPLIDIDALGVVLETKRPPARQRERARARSNAPMKAPDVRVREFERLMARLGIHRGCDDEFHECPWHTETEASLHVSWTEARFFCFGCREGGGVRRLRELLGEPVPPTCNPSSEFQSPIGRGLQLGGSRVQGERGRLADALEALGYSRRAEQMRQCREATWDAPDADIEAFACPNGDAAPAKAQTISCDDPQCPACMPWRLAADWRGRWAKRAQEQPGGFTLAVLRAPTSVTASTTGPISSACAHGFASGIARAT